MSFFSRKKEEVEDKEFTDLDEYNRQKVQIKVVTLFESDDYKKVINSLASEAVTLVNIKPLLQSDKMALKLAIELIKKTCRTFDADIAALSEDMVVVAPKGVEIYRKDRASQKTSPSISPELPGDENNF